MENDSEIWEISKIFGKWLRYMGQGLSFGETVLLCLKWLKNLTNGLTLSRLQQDIFGTIVSPSFDFESDENLTDTHTQERLAMLFRSRQS